jgi:methionyl-tRNA formyltransferase
VRVLRTRVVVPDVGAASELGRLDGAVVATGDGGLELVTVQPEGKGPMPAAAWLHGARPAPGERLGT